MALGATFRYAGTVTDGKTVVEPWHKDKVVEVSGENPGSLRVFDQDCRMNAPVHSFRTGQDSWEERYKIIEVLGYNRVISIEKEPIGPGRTYVSYQYVSPPVSEFETVTLRKSLDHGLTEIIFGNKDNESYIFRPDDGHAVPVIAPPVMFINHVEFANVRKDGTVINDYGSVFDRHGVYNLSTRINYQTGVKGREVTLDIKITNPRTRFIYPPNNFTTSIPVKTAVDSVGSINFSLDLRSFKHLQKGSRMEIYADNQRLYSVEIPIKGIVMYMPVESYGFRGIAPQFSISGMLDWIEMEM